MDKRGEYVRTSGGVREGTLEEILRINAELAKLQHDNDKVQRRMLYLTGIAVFVSLSSLVVAIIALLG